MKVSILMPVHNAANWLEETLHSIQGQSYCDWELLAVDDHSNDASFSLLQKFALEDARIRVMRNEGKGIIPALQQALRQANGRYVTRMDADDKMPSERLEIMMKALEMAGRRHIVTGKVQYFPEPLSPGYVKYQDWLNARIDHGDHFDHLFRECVIASPNWLVYREDLLDDRIFEQLNYPEDYDMVFRWKTAGYKIVGIPVSTLLWREHPARTSRNSSVYNQASFFELKLKWFFAMDSLNGRSLALFGTGVKGKLVARYLLDHGTPFTWYDRQYKKYGAGIFSCPIHDPIEAQESCAMVCVYPDDSSALERFLHKKNYQLGENAWYF